MSRKLLSLLAAVTLTAQAAIADVPKVAADAAPIHSLVARVMEGVGTPSLLMASTASPHDYSLRPSQATALQAAEIVVWTGPELTPWLERAIGTLAADATIVTLLDLPGSEVLEMREDPRFEAHAHEEDGTDHNEEGHEEEAHGEEGHEDDEHAEEGHDEAGHEEDEHAHLPGARDSHAWLSPQNASVWVEEIAEVLATADPDNAATYRANAAEAQTEIAAMTADIKQMLAPMRGREFIVFHDAYQYFEVAFDMPAAGAIAIGDATDPGPARIAEIRARVAEAGVSCVLAEPQFDPSLVDTVLDGTPARTAVIDPLGAALEPGPALYPRMMRALAETLAGCL